MTKPQWLLQPDWPAPASVRAAVTTRRGGVSTGPHASLNLAAHVGDDPAAVAENRRRVATALGLPAEPAWLQQVHGTTVARDGSAAMADASIATGPGRVCVVLTADCLPVLFAQGDGDCVGVAHAGWRGLAAGVLEATIAALGVPPHSLLAWLGPAIGADAFEVGDEVRAAFTSGDPGAATHFRAGRAGRWQADLEGLARRRLAAAGVTAIHGGGLCTFSDAARFYSYRRDGATGRMATMVWLD